MNLRDGFYHPESVLQAAALETCMYEFNEGVANGGWKRRAHIMGAWSAYYQYIRVHLTEVAKAINADGRGKFRKPQWDAGDCATLTEWILCDGDISEVQRLRGALDALEET